MVSDFNSIPIAAAMIAFSWRCTSRFAAALAAAFLLLAVVDGLSTQKNFDRSLDHENSPVSNLKIPSINVSHRKLLDQDERSNGTRAETQRIGEGCSKDDIVLYQGATSPLPNGIPTYTVEVLNVCLLPGCSIGHIHLSCGWFSSARLVNPRLFRRIAYNDCLLNDGRPLPAGSSITFQYANSFRYPLSVASAQCLT